MEEKWKWVCSSWWQSCPSLSQTEAPEGGGVFLIYEEGQVSFYDVETSSHIYSFTGFTFTEKLCPFLNPETDIDGENSSPLVITPVSQIDEPDMKEKTWSEIEIRNIACIFFFFFLLDNFCTICLPKFKSCFKFNLASCHTPPFSSIFFIISVLA